MIYLPHRLAIASTTMQYLDYTAMSAVSAQCVIITQLVPCVLPNLYNVPTLSPRFVIITLYDVVSAVSACVLSNYCVTHNAGCAVIITQLGPCVLSLQSYCCVCSHCPVTYCYTGMPSCQQSVPNVLLLVHN